MKEFLGKDTLTMAIVSVSPNVDDVKETITSVRFGVDLRQIRKE